MNVWHVYARYYNFGDYALGVGIRNIFSKYFSSRLLFKLYDTHNLEFDEKTLRELNTTSDLMIVGGGGLIHGWAGDKWMFKIPNELIPLLKTPTIVYGVGYNQFRGEPELDPQIIENIKLLNESCVSFSVRNDGSKEEMARLGINLPEVPDPGFFVDGDYPRPNIEGEYVILQLANDMKYARGYEDNTFLKQLTIAVEHLLKHNYQVVLCPHVRNDDVLGQQLIKLMENPPGLISWDWFDIIRDDNVSKGLAYYKYAKFVIGMRGHAQICSIGLITPVITIGSHRKNLDLLKRLNMSEYYVDVADLELDKKLINLIEKVEINYDSIKAAYLGMMNIFTEQAKVFLNDLFIKTTKFKKEVCLVEEPIKPNFVTKIRGFLSA